MSSIVGGAMMTAIMMVVIAVFTGHGEKSKRRWGWLAVRIGDAMKFVRHVTELIVVPLLVAYFKYKFGPLYDEMRGDKKEIMTSDYR